MDRKTLWAGLVAALAIACGDAAGEMMGGAFIETGGQMKDASDMLRDSGMDMLADAAAEAGNALQDAGRNLDGGDQGDASAQDGEPIVLEGDCELESGVQTTEDNGDYSISLKRYAEIDVSAYEPEQLVGAAFVLCERDDELDTNPFPSLCDAGSDTPLPTCIGEYPLPLADCIIETTIEIQDGKARVWCGAHEERDYGELESAGHTYESVRLVIPAGAP